MTLISAYLVQWASLLPSSILIQMWRVSDVYLWPDKSIDLRSISHQLLRPLFFSLWRISSKLFTLITLSLPPFPPALSLYVHVFAPPLVHSRYTYCDNIYQTSIIPLTRQTDRQSGKLADRSKHTRAKHTLRRNILNILFIVLNKYI